LSKRERTVCIHARSGLSAWIYVEFTTDRRVVTNYAVLLYVREKSGETLTVRVYDGAHGQNEMHRCIRVGGKQTAEVFNRDTLGVGMRAAIKDDLAVVLVSADGSTRVLRAEPAHV